MTLALQRVRCCNCGPGGKRPYGYSGLCRRVGEYARAHEPGRTMLADRAGPTASAFGPVADRRPPACLFVSSFPWPAWACAGCFPDMRGRSRVSARVRALQAAGGAPDIFVPDSCAAATDGRRGSEPIKVDNACLETVGHRGCAAVPARVRRPGDRAAAEKAASLCEAWALAPLADERFASLDKLNAEVRRLVGALNARPFYGEERAALSPLPATPFERHGWRRRKASPDYHVRCDHMRCSALCRLVGGTVDARPAPPTCPRAHRGAAAPGARVVRVPRRQDRPRDRGLVGSALDARPIKAQGCVPRPSVLSPSGRGRAAGLEAACAKAGAAAYARVENAMAAMGTGATAAPSAGEGGGAGAMLGEGGFALLARWRIGTFGRKPRGVRGDGALDDVTFEDKIGARIDAEPEARDGGKMDKAARFEIKGACVEDICHLPDRNPTRDRTAGPASCAWAKARENPAIISESGGGKGHIAQALGDAARRSLMSARCARPNDMFREIDAARGEGRGSTMLAS